MSGDSSIRDFLGINDELVTIPEEVNQRYIALLLDNQPEVQLPDFGDMLVHETYERVRQQLATQVTLAGLIGHESLASLVDTWVELQKGYAEHLMKKMDGILDDQRQLLSAANDDLEAGQPDRDELAQLSQLSAGEMEDDQLSRMLQLRKKVESLDKTVEERDEFQRSIASASIVEETLGALSKMGRPSIHYGLQPIASLQDELAKGTYTGPLLDPFTIYTNTKIDDLFSRDVSIPSILQSNFDPAPTNGDGNGVDHNGDTANGNGDVDLSELPDVLSDIVKLYEAVRAIEPGQHIDCTKLKNENALDAHKTRAISGYLSNDESVFGVELKMISKRRQFVRRAGGTPQMSRSDLIKYMLKGKISQPYMKLINQFYLEKAAELMREHPKAYDGFTKTELKKVVADNGLHVSAMYLGKNFHELDGVERTHEGAYHADPDVYVFTEIQASETQIAHVQLATEEFGINRFEPGDLVAKVKQMNGGYVLAEKVAAHIMDANLEEWGFRLASKDPLQYQKADRSGSAEALVDDEEAGQRLM